MGSRPGAASFAMSSSGTPSRGGASGPGIYVAPTSAGSRPGGRPLAGAGGYTPPGSPQH
jgi:hypothetical protein